MKNQKKIKEYILNLCPDEYKLIFEGIAHAQIHFLCLLEDLTTFKNDISLKDYIKIKTQLDKINLLIKKFTNYERNKTSSKIQ